MERYNEQKKKLLFVVQGLSRGGTEWTLIEALNVINYSEFDVILYVRKKNHELLRFVDSRVNVIINENQNDSLDIFGLILRCFSATFERLCFKGLGKEFRRMHRKHVLRKRIRTEKRCFKDREFDIAVAYDMANDCANFVKEICANKKYVFFHGSEVDRSKYSIYAGFDKIITVNKLARKKF